jgi:hypothetical protein
MESRKLFDIWMEFEGEKNFLFFNKECMYEEYIETCYCTENDIKNRDRVLYSLKKENFVRLDDWSLDEYKVKSRNLKYEEVNNKYSLEALFNKLNAREFLWFINDHLDFYEPNYKIL